MLGLSLVIRGSARAKPGVVRGLSLVIQFQMRQYPINFHIVGSVQLHPLGLGRGAGLSPRAHHSELGGELGSYRLPWWRSSWQSVRRSVLGEERARGGEG